MIVDKLKNSILKSLIENGISKIEPEKLEFEKCIINLSSKNYQIKQSEIFQNGLYPVVSQSQKLIEGYSNEKDKLFHHDNPVLIYGDHSNTIKYIDFDFIIGADGTKIFNCNSDFDLKYLYYNIMYNLINIPNNGYSRHYKYLKKIPIYYYPIEEQHIIVNKIEELFEKIHEIEPIELTIQKLKESLPLDMKKSILASVFSGEMTKRESTDTPIENMMKKILEQHEELLKNKIIKRESKITKVDLSKVPFSIPNEWCWSKMYFCLDVRDGTHDSPRYTNDGIPLITSKNLNKDGTLNNFDLKYISDNDRDKINNRSKVDKGDILFAMIGSIGNPVIIDYTPDFCIKNVALFKNPVKKLINNKYLYYYLDYSQERMKKESTGGVQQFVSLNYLRNYYIPIPPIEEQQRIVDKIEQLLPLCNDIENLVNSK